MSDWLLVAGDFMPHGGMDRANHALAMTLAERSPRSVTLVAHRVAADLERPGVTIARVPRPWGSHLLGAPLLSRAGARAVRRLPAGGRSVVNGGNVENDDVNWVHYLHSAYVPAARGARRRAQVFVSHRYDLSRERRSLARARVIVCNSRMTAADVAAHARGSASVKVVYYGTDPATFSYVDAEARRAARTALGWDPNRPSAIFIGALGDRRKGFDRVLETWRILVASGPWDTDLVVVGAGSELPAWQRRAAADGLAARVRFLGFRTDVPRLLAASDLLVHPSRYEAYGLGVHEAICRGLTAIVSARAGIAERYPDALRHWLIPDVEDAADLAARVRRWREDPAAAAAGMQPFSATLRARTWRDMADEFIEAVAS
jgi:glycosyltransferase involved in cell wall biosynthesis